MEEIFLGQRMGPCPMQSQWRTQPVRQVAAGKSVSGCYDMAGGVYEWCADWYLDTYYTESPYKNPKGPDKAAKRVIREAPDSQTISAQNTQENRNSQTCSIWRSKIPLCKDVKRRKTS